MRGKILLAKNQIALSTQSEIKEKPAIRQITGHYKHTTNIKDVTAKII